MREREFKKQFFAALAPEKEWYDFERLFEAARKSDLTVLKKCLLDIRLNDKSLAQDVHPEQVLSDSLDYCLEGSSHCQDDTSSAKCLEYLIKKGAKFYEPEDFHIGDFFTDETAVKNNKKSVYNAVKFALTHGAVLRFSNEDIDRLINIGVMDEDTFYAFAKRGDLYEEKCRILKEKSLKKGTEKSSLKKTLSKAQKGKLNMHKKLDSNGR